MKQENCVSKRVDGPESQQKKRQTPQINGEIQASFIDVNNT